MNQTHFAFLFLVALFLVFALTFVLSHRIKKANDLSADHELAKAQIEKLEAQVIRAEKYSTQSTQHFINVAERVNEIIGSYSADKNALLKIIDEQQKTIHVLTKDKEAEFNLQKAAFEQWTSRYKGHQSANPFIS